MAITGIRRVIIIGAGQAGGEAAQRLRHGGFDGEITLIGEEPIAPYQRPPLSKAYLAGKMERDRLMLRPPEVYADEHIALLTGTRAVWIDRTNRRVRLEGGRELSFDAVILATGARPRRLPLAGADLDGVHLVRTIADIDAIQPGCKPGAKLVVIGAGFIGLEAAAVARSMGVEVCVVETAVRPLARVTSPEVAGFFLDEHTRQGVRFVLSAQPALIQGDEHVRGVKLTDGTEIAADMVIAGIGVTPETALAQHCGLTVEDGIVTDRQCRTSDPSIFAIGDCARRPMVHYDQRVARLESVHNAVEGGRVAAAAILGTEHTEETPWFWSDQYDIKLQIAGLFQGYDTMVMRGDTSSRSFAAFYYKGGRMIAVDAVNRPAEFLGSKLLIQKGLSIPAETLRDSPKPMKELVAEAR